MKFTVNHDRYQAITITDDAFNSITTALTKLCGQYEDFFIKKSSEINALLITELKIDKFIPTSEERESTNVISPILLCLEHSDDPLGLITVFNKDISIHITIGSVVPSPWHEDAQHTKIQKQLNALKMFVTLKRKDTTVEFDYYGSHNDAMLFHTDNIYNKAIRQEKNKFYRQLLYSILCTIGSDGRCDTESFEYFCREFGYDTDSRKALDTYLAIGTFKSKIFRIFSHKDLESFPS